MKVAVIDMGTNTFHLLLAEVNGSHYKIFQRERRAVKIGKGGINDKKITPSAWKRAINTVKEYRRIIDQQSITQIFATATSAIRNANNGIELTEEIKRETGIETEIISGTKEAELILKGAKKALKIGDKKNLIMDIGGGSIEFIIADNTKTYWLRSFEIGGQRLVEKFHKTDPIDKIEINSLYKFFDIELEALLEACQIHKPNVLIGCSGTFDTLSDIYCEENNIKKEADATEYPFPISAFQSIYQELVQKNRAERLTIPGMIEMRVDMIVVACVLLNYLIKKLELNEIRVSAYALKEGVLYNALDKINLKKPTNS